MLVVLACVVFHVGGYVFRADLLHKPDWSSGDCNVRSVAELLAVLCSVHPFFLCNNTHSEQPFACVFAYCWLLHLTVYPTVSSSHSVTFSSNKFFNVSHPAK